MSDPCLFFDAVAASLRATDRTQIDAARLALSGLSERLNPGISSHSRALDALVKADDALVEVLRQMSVAQSQIAVAHIELSTPEKLSAP